MSTQDANPLVAFEADASAPILRYDLPDPSSYSGRSVIELNVPADCFNAAAFEIPEQATAAEEDATETGSGTGRLRDTTNKIGNTTAETTRDPDKLTTERDTDAGTAEKETPSGSDPKDKGLDAPERK